MQILKQAHGFKTVEIATKKIELAISRHGEAFGTKHPVRWIMSVNEAGRFAPVVVNPANFAYWLHGTKFAITGG